MSYISPPQDVIANPRGKQQPSRFKLLLGLFVCLAVIIFLFAILSQPLGLITDTLNDAYPNTNGSGNSIDYTPGHDQNAKIQAFLVLGLGAAVIIGLFVLLFAYGYRNLGGGGRDSFG